MSEDIDVIEQTDKELNFEKMRQKQAELEARNAELEPLALAQAVRDAGFQPGTPEWNTLTKFAGVGADVEAVKNLAADLGFEPSKPAPQLNANEQVAVLQGQRLADINSVTSPDTPTTLVQDIKEAEAKQDWSLVTRLNSQLLAQQMSAKARG